MKMQENNADFRVIFMIFSNLVLIMYRFLPLNHSLLKYICTTSKRKTKCSRQKYKKMRIFGRFWPFADFKMSIVLIVPIKSLKIGIFLLSGPNYMI